MSNDPTHNVIDDIFTSEGVNDIFQEPMYFIGVKPTLEITQPPEVEVFAVNDEDIQQPKKNYIRKGNVLMEVVVNKRFIR